jgi:hypothetical protein
MDRPVEFERRENGPLKLNEKFKILQTHSFHENIALQKKMFGWNVRLKLTFLLFSLHGPDCVAH